MDADKLVHHYINRLQVMNTWSFGLLLRSIERYHHGVGKLITHTIQDFIEGYNEVVMSLYELARRMTWPWHWFWIFGWIRSIQPRTEKFPIFDDGTHYFQALQGGGKSSSMFQGIKIHARETGKAAYISTSMELPKQDDYSFKWFVNNRYFLIDEFFKNRKQIKRFDSDHFDKVIIDEMNFSFNNRENMTSVYRDAFIGLIGAVATQRHAKIKLMWFAGQQFAADKQLMGLLTWYHKVRIKKGFDKKYWNDTGRFRIGVIGWKFISYKVEPKGDGFTLHGKKKWFLPKLEEMEDFNTLNMAPTLMKMPVDQNFKFYTKGH